MAVVLNYGEASSVRLEPADDQRMVVCGGRPQEAIADLAEAVEAALSNPLEYPALARATTPGDRIVLALEEGVPQAAVVVEAIIGHLERAGVGLDGIAILEPAQVNDIGLTAAREHWPEHWREQIALVRHDPTDRRQLAYLAATDAGRTIFLNRILTDADLVLPIGTIHRQGAGYHGIHSPLFPGFSDEKAIARYRRSGGLRRAGPQKQELDHEVDEVAWLLGITFTIQVVPGGGDRVSYVLAGQPEAVRRRGRELYRAAWKCRVDERAGLVVAAMEGGAEQQTWANLSRALAAARPLVEDGGAIALCCDLAAPPGPAVQCLAESESRMQAIAQIRQRRPADTLLALQLASTQRYHDVYLLSRLDPTLVERLEMSPLRDGDELARLVRHQPSCIVLGNAPHVVVKRGSNGSE